MDRPRVVSLAPSVTAIVRAVGATDRLVGVTHHCDPGDIEPAPERVGGWITPNLDRVDALDPDLVITSDGLQADIVDALTDRGHRVCHHEPETLSDVFDSISAIGEAIDRSTASSHLVTDLQARVHSVTTRVADSNPAATDRPVVYCEEWSDPPMAAGNWVPDIVEAAGGHYPFVDPGSRSREIDRDTVEQHDPDHIILHPCGYGDRADPRVIHDRGWDLDAAVHTIPDDLLNQPGPSLIDGLEQLARILHPDALETTATTDD